MPNPPLVSVVVSIYNNVELSRQCLMHLFRQDYPQYEVIVVDNGSQDDISGMVAGEFPQVRLLRLEKNRGAAGGYNHGMQAAEGKYTAMINNDAMAAPNWLRVLVEEAEKDEKLGAVSSVILDGNYPGLIDSYGVGLALDGMSRQLMRGARMPTEIDDQSVLLVSGCACLLRTSALLESGYMDEDFFAYCDDSDLILRLTWAGYRSKVTARTHVNHLYSMTFGKFSAQKVFWVERNHFWLAVKNFPAPLLALLPILTLYRYILQVYLVVFKVGDIAEFVDKKHPLSMLKTMLRAYGSCLAGLPTMMRKRRQIMRQAKRATREMRGLMWQYHVPIYQIFANPTAKRGE